MRKSKGSDDKIVVEKPTHINLSLHDFDGKTIEEVIEYLQSLKNELPDNVIEGIFRLDIYDDFQSDLQLYVRRLETDKEKEKRIEKRKKNYLRRKKILEEEKSRVDEYERKEYERLKLKYEGNT